MGNKYYLLLSEHTHTLSLSLSLSHTLTHSHTHPLFLSLSLTYRHTHIHKCFNKLECLFLSSPMFANKVNSLPQRGAPFSQSTTPQGQTLVLITNIRLGWHVLLGTLVNCDKKNFNIGPWREGVCRLIWIQKGSIGGVKSLQSQVTYLIWTKELVCLFGKLS